MLIERARRATRWGAFSLLIFGLIAAWASFGAYAWLRLWWPEWAAAVGVTGITMLLYGLAVGLRRYRSRRRQAEQGSPPPMPTEMLEILERWTAYQPWLAVGIAGGLGWVAARSNADPKKTLEQALEVMRGMEAARQQMQHHATPPR